MIHHIKRTIVNNIKNIPGWKINRKLVVFESDDWGSLRIGSARQLNDLVQSGVISKGANSYDKLDALESSDDMELLFNVLRSVKDKNGNHAVFTPFVNPCNPDFEKIATQGFQAYHYESFDRTLQRYDRHGVMDCYRHGLREKLFVPEYHGREHVHVGSWMKALQDGNPAVIKGFKHEFSSVNTGPSGSFMEAFRPTYYFSDHADIPALKASLRDGALIFEKLFNYQTRVFDAPNAIFHPDLEQVLHEVGIQNIVLPFFRPEPDSRGGLRTKYYRFGKRNGHGQIYYTRNCMFEPRIAVDENVCLQMIKAAFRWNKPAIITTHRVNYMGMISPENRLKSLKSLTELLKNILKTWPDAEFISSGDFAKIIHGQ